MRNISLGIFLLALTAVAARGEDAPPESSAPPADALPETTLESAAAEEVSEAPAEGGDGVLEDGEGVVSDAATRRMGKSDKKAKTKSRAGKSAAIRGGGKAESGADSEEGWIIRKTADGYVKVPAKQTFRFEGNVSGQANRPTQSVLGQRPSYRPSTLIPERMSFRREFLEAAGTGR